MKRLYRLCLLLAAACVFAFASLASAQSVGRATADFPNLKPNRQETPWGRLVADSLQSAGKADMAIINAGALRTGTLEAGAIEGADIAALLSFGDDDVVTLSLSGAQVRAALERAASAYPTGSPAEKDGDFARITSERHARDEQAEDYDRMISMKALGLIEIPQYKRALSQETNSVLLEAGCGTGRLTHIFAQIAPEVVGVDMSRESLVRNRVRHHARTFNPVHYVHADLTHLPLKDGVFGRCAHAGVYEHIPSRDLRLQFLSHARRTMKSGGVLMLSAYRYGGLTKLFEKEGEHDGGIPFFRFTPDELKAEVETAFQVEKFVSNLGVYMSMVVARA